ncbi:MAG TPA: hypothetical protein VHD56_12935 [Tepidisphaeraceae bacterium]|nr:hypothetical protein [Tepidisphaeraceae bacterium]
MLPPAYVAREVGDGYELVRIDLGAVLEQTCTAAVGLALIRYSIPRNGLMSALMAACGAALAYKGLSGKNPIQAMLGQSNIAKTRRRSRQLHKVPPDLT